MLHTQSHRWDKMANRCVSVHFCEQMGIMLAGTVNREAEAGCLVPAPWPQRKLLAICNHRSPRGRRNKQFLHLHLPKYYTGQSELCPRGASLIYTTAPPAVHFVEQHATRRHGERLDRRLLGSSVHFICS